MKVELSKATKATLRFEAIVVDLAEEIKLLDGTEFNEFSDDERRHYAGCDRLASDKEILEAKLWSAQSNLKSYTARMDRFTKWVTVMERFMESSDGEATRREPAELHDRPEQDRNQRQARRAAQVETAGRVAGDVPAIDDAERGEAEAWDL